MKKFARDLFLKKLLLISSPALHKINKGDKMKYNEKDPYNLEKTGEFIREYNLKTNGKKEYKGKIYQKSPKAEERDKSSQ